MIVGDGPRNNSPSLHVVKQMRLDDRRFHHSFIHQEIAYPCLRPSPGNHMHSLTGRDDETACSDKSWTLKTPVRLRGWHTKCDVAVACERLSDGRRAT